MRLLFWSFGLVYGDTSKLSRVARKPLSMIKMILLTHVKAEFKKGFHW